MTIIIFKYIFLTLYIGFKTVLVLLYVKLLIKYFAFRLIIRKIDCHSLFDTLIYIYIYIYISIGFDFYWLKDN